MATPSESTKPKRAVVYLRVSTKDQNPENQLAQLREYASRSGWEVLEVITDKVSGTKSATERRGLSKVLALASKRQFDVLLFWSLDRLTREGLRETLDYLHTLNTNGVDWHSYSEAHISTLGPVRNIVIAIMSTFAEIERQRISERTKAGLDRARTQGKTLGRPKGGRSKQTNPRIAEAKRLRSEGKTYRDIAAIIGTTHQYAMRLCGMDLPKA